jgi:hypothetical protein
MNTGKLPLKLLCLSIILLSAFMEVPGQSISQNTYINPLNIDYTYAIYDSHRDLSYRSGADPAVVEFRGEYYMFVTRSMGYWHSKDLQNWSFIEPEKWYFEGSNAPSAHNFKDSVLFVAGNPSGHMSVLYTDDPKKGNWRAVPGIINDLQDPHIFVDEDDQAYVFWGSSNTYPIRARRLDMGKRFRPEEKIHELFKLDGEKHGWERFGENHADTVLKGYMEGPWLTKYKDTYYMQYAAPGTEFNVYGDGVYTSDSPLGPYKYASNNPISYKPGGFINGAGHGSTVIGPGQQYWHFGSMSISVNVNWERRLAMFPTYFDENGLMYSDTNFGDYPRYGTMQGSKTGKFTGWMLLSYKKPIKASSSLDEYIAENANDENVRTFWVAKGKDEGEFLEIDLLNPAQVYAIQINYHDYQSDLYGRLPNLYHRYTIEGSLDGQDWFMLADKSENFQDVPNDYVELGEPQRVRYIRYNHIHVPTPHLSVSGLRVFGKGEGKIPRKIKNFQLQRHDDRRDITLTWDNIQGAQGYNIKWGIAPDKLYSSWLVYDTNEHHMKTLGRDQVYYFAVEAFNENGISELSEIVKVE